MNLDAYFRRIGYVGPTVPTLALLNSLTAAHAESIPFENIDVVLQRPIDLEPEMLYRKLVEHRRGGYCFEQNGLFLEVLKDLGFDVRPLSARVRLGEMDRSVVVARTHMLIEVCIDGNKWLTDVGVGSASLTRALRFEVDVEQHTRHDKRRLVREGERWFHQLWHNHEWVDVYEFSGETMPFIDRVVANWYVSTHPLSFFRRNISVALARANGSRITLRGAELTVHSRDGSTDSRRLVGMHRYLATLRDCFGIELPVGTELPPIA